MSTILKALRRLEEDRRNQDERSLRDRILSKDGRAGSETGEKGPQGAVLAGVGMFALLAAGFLGWWVLAGKPRGAPPLFVEDAAVVSRDMATGGPANAAAVALPPVSAPTPVAQAAASSRDVEASIPQVVRVEPPPGIAEDIGLVTRPAERAAVEMAPPVERARAPSPAPRAIAAKPKPNLRPLAKPASSLEATTREVPAIRQIERLPMPEFVVLRTVWHPEASRRVAMIRLSGQSAAKAFGQGEAMGVLEIVEIQPASVLFRRDGVEIERRVGR